MTYGYCRSFIALGFLLTCASTSLAGDGRIDFGPVAIPLFEALSALAAVALGWLGLLLRSLLKSRIELYTQETDAKVRDYLEVIVRRGIDYAVEEMGERVGAGALSIEVKSSLIEAAGDFIAAHAPDAIRRFELTPEKIANMVRARLDIATLPQIEMMAAT